MTLDTFLNRREAAIYLHETYGSPGAVTAKTLAKLACCGGGPVFHYFGRKPAYKTTDLDAWAASRLSAPQSNTSKHWGVK